MHLDNALFLDWFASLGGIYYQPETDAYYRLELDRGTALRVTTSLGDEPVPLSVVDVLERCYRYCPLPVARTRPAVTLARLGRSSRARRLVLEATLQRRRLCPYWLRWIAAQSSGEYNARHCDRYILRFLPNVTFDDLVVVAQIIPWVGPGITWALFRADAVKAALLFEEWIAAGEPERFRDLGGSFQELATQYAGSAIDETLMRVNSVMAHYGYVTQPVE